MISTLLPKAWDRQKGESRQAFDAFAAHRDATTRSLTEVARGLGKSRALLDRWSSRWSWVERSRAWDQFVDQEKQRSQIEEAREIGVRHARIAAAIQAKVVERIRSIDIERVSLRDMVYAFDIAVKVERLALGMPTENRQVTGQDGGPIQVEVESKPDFSRMTTEELEALELLLRRLHDD